MTKLETFLQCVKVVSAIVMIVELVVIINLLK